MSALPLLSVPSRALPRVCLAGLAAVGCALGVQAGVVEPAVDLLHPGGGLSAPAVSTLERALTVDINTSQRNLELLIDARRAGDGAGAAPLRTGEVPGQRRALPVAEPQGSVVPLGLQGQDSLTAPGAAERREWLSTSPTSRGADMPAQSQANARAGRGDPGVQAGRPDRWLAPGEPGELPELLANTVQFLRDHRFWLLGGLALLALLVASVQAFAQRR